MNGSHPVLIHSIASIRNQEFRAQAEHDRLVNEASRENGIPSAVDRVRHILGNALVRVGHLVGGQRAPRPAADRGAAANVLNLAR